MYTSFAETLKMLRTKRNLSQQQLADLLIVDRSSVSRWENGSRLPDVIILSRLANCLGVDTSVLLDISQKDQPVPNIILVDDEEILLAGAMPILANAIPQAAITGFTRISEAITFATTNPISIAFLDIELGQSSGLELCNTLLSINPLTNIIFLTSYPDYAIDAWDTNASGFLVKPLHEEDVRRVLTKLRNPVKGI